MIAKISRGGHVTGLLRYLVDTRPVTSRGRNAHTNPHLVAGDPFVVGVGLYDGELTVEDAHELGGFMDAPRVQMGVKVQQRATMQDEHGAKTNVMVLDRDGGMKQKMLDAHVWHCSLSLSVDEGAIGDELWGKVANDFMEGMGWNGTAEVAPARWLAVHHGTSTSGNDHIHIVGSIVRNDGTRVDMWNDRKRASRLVAEIEKKYGLNVVEGRTSEVGKTRGDSLSVKGQAEWGLPHSIKDELALRVRAAGLASSTEARFVRLVREDGMVIKPRFAKGSTTEVTGYRVALKKPGVVGKPELSPFFGGTSLGRDLRLPSLRMDWVPDEDTAAEWAAAHGGKRPVVTERPRVNVSALSDLVNHMRAAQTPAEWARAAHDVSGVLAAAARLATHQTGYSALARSLARSSAVIGRNAQLPIGQNHAHRNAAQERLVQNAQMFLFAALSNNPLMIPMLFLVEMERFAAACQDYRRARGQLFEAQRLAREARSSLDTLPWAHYVRALPTGIDLLTVPASASVEAGKTEGTGGSVSTRQEPKPLTVQDVLKSMPPPVPTPKPVTKPPAIVETAEMKRTLELNEGAETFWGSQFPGSVAETYMEGRFGTSTFGAFSVGYASAEWTALVDHLRTHHGATDEEMLTAGLAARSKRGTLIDVFRERVVLSIKDEKGRAIGFTARDLSGKERAPKYVNSTSTPVFQKGDVVFGMYEGRRARPTGKTPVVVRVEGAMDALAVTLASGGDAAGVAPMGTALTEPQAKIIRDEVGQTGMLVSGLDGDKAGRAAMLKDWPLLAEVGDMRLLKFADGDDAALLAQRGTLTDAITATCAVDGPRAAAAVAEARLAMMTYDSPEQRVWYMQNVGADLSAAAPDDWKANAKAAAELLDRDDARRISTHIMHAMIYAYTGAASVDGEQPVVKIQKLRELMNHVTEPVGWLPALHSLEGDTDRPATVWRKWAQEAARKPSATDLLRHGHEPSTTPPHVDQTAHNEVSARKDHANDSRHER